MNQRICPVCGSDDLTPAYPEFTGTVITSDYDVIPQGTLANRQCRRCGLIFNAGGTRGQTSEFYATMYQFMLQTGDAAVADHTSKQPKTLGERSSEILQELLDVPEKGRVLEAGAGKGDFLRHFATSRPEWEVTAFEPSASFDVLSKRLPDADLRHLGYQEFDAAPESYDLVVALGVLEHVENPLDMLRWARGLLKDGGHFFIRVPDFGKNPNDLFCADHLSKLTQGTIRHLAGEAGYEVVGEQANAVPMFHCLRKDDAAATIAPPVEENAAILNRNVDEARAMMAAIDHARLTASNAGEKFAIFGLASVGLFSPFNCGFEADEITCYVDENKSMWNSKIHGRPVGGLELINDLDVRHIAFAMSPVYHDKVAEKLKDYGVTLHRI